MDPSISVHGGPTRRRHNRENETESQKLKREKAAERQRRKRERDRRNNTVLQQQHAQAQAVAAAVQQQHQVPPPQVVTAPAVVQTVQQVVQPPPPPPPPMVQEDHYIADPSPEEEARREKVRAAARERQRKHRALVKQRRMRELGLDMGNEILPGMEEVHYRAAADGQYHPVIPPELQLANAPSHALQPHEPPFPQGAPLGGQTFASTLLLSFSCAPLLKQHLLRTLAMSNEELASLEPIIAEAWDRWDHQRRVHYAEIAKNGGAPPPLPPLYTVEMAHDVQTAPPGAFANGPSPSEASSSDAQALAQAQAAAAANDFRARFHRSILAPSPFQTASTSSTASSASAPPNGEGVIDPHLADSDASSPDASMSASTTTTATTKTEVH